MSTYADELHGVYGYGADEYGGVEGLVRRGARRALLGGTQELGEFPLGLLYVLETGLLAFTMWGFGIILGYLKGSPMIGQIIAGLVLGPGVLNIVPTFMIPGKSASETGTAPARPGRARAPTGGGCGPATDRFRAAPSSVVARLQGTGTAATPATTGTGGRCSPGAVAATR